MNKHYIYFHINPLKNEIFYVGQGTKNRAYYKFSRNKFWKSTVAKYGLIVDIIETDLTKEEADIREKFYISKLGRRDLGTGNLVNMTDGGEGTCNTKHFQGKKHSSETKNKMSEWQIGKVLSEVTKEKIRKKQIGNLASEETKKKMSEAHKRRWEKLKNE